jgi:hypothetical protein
MILCISVNLVKFCVSEVGEFWWRFFYFAWRMKGDGERGVVDGIGCPRLSCNVFDKRVSQPIFHLKSYFLNNS